MQSVPSIARQAVLCAFALFAIAYSGLAPAVYVFTRIDYPGATFTQTFGINNSGQIAVTSSLGAFIYQNGTFYQLAPPAGAEIAPSGINDQVQVVGGAYNILPGEAGFIYQGGPYRIFAHPGWLNTEGRAIGNSGLVTGFAYNSDAFALGGSVGFIYNPATDSYTDIVPAANTGIVIAQGINAAGQVVGSFHVQGIPDQTAFLREPDGSINTFRINGLPTTARGINDNGVIAGAVNTPTGAQAFVGNSLGFQLLQCPASVCPGVVETYAESINNAGQIVGGWRTTIGDFAHDHGFIATPAELPTGTTSGGAYVFNVAVVPNVEIFIDPSVAVGYDYAIGTGDPKFATVRLPIGIGDNLYTLITHGQAFTLAGGDLFDFRAHGFPKGVAQFRVADIEESANLDPTNPTAFPTGLTFMTAGTFTGTMTPLCQFGTPSSQANVPSGRGLSACGQ